MTHTDPNVFEDAGRLQDWLATHERTPYVDFEILTVTLGDGAVEVDPKGQVEDLIPLLEGFARLNGYDVGPFDPDSGTISLFREAFRDN